MVRAYRESGTLMAAVELGLFTQVARGADTEAALARALDIEPVNAERLVTVCVGLELLKRNGDRLENAPDVARFLVEGERNYAGAWMLFTKPDWDEWGRLADHLRRMGPPSTLGMYNDFTVERARRYHEATYSIGMGAGHRFNRHVDLSGCRRILDLGGGSGAYCIVSCQKHPQLTAVVMDLPPVAEVAREFIAEHGLSDRIEALAGDFTEDPFPRDADVAIMASNLPIYGREMIQRVVTKTFEALLPGGEMHLIGEMLNAERTGPPDSGLWAMAQALYGSGGIAHSVKECIRYFETAGFTGVTAESFVPGVLIRVSGTKHT